MNFSKYRRNYLMVDRESNFNEMFWHPLAFTYIESGYTIQNALNNLRRKCRKKGLDAIRPIPDNPNEYYCGIVKKKGGIIYNKVHTGYRQKKGDYIAVVVWVYGKTKKSKTLLHL